MSTNQTVKIQLGSIDGRRKRRRRRSKRKRTVATPSKIVQPMNRVGPMMVGPGGGSGSFSFGGGGRFPFPPREPPQTLNQKLDHLLSALKPDVKPPQPLPRSRDDQYAEVTKVETEAQRRKRAFENAHVMDIDDDEKPFADNIKPPTPAPSNSPNAFKQLGSSFTNYVPPFVPEPPPPFIPEPDVPKVKPGPEPNIPEYKPPPAPPPPPPPPPAPNLPVREPTVPFLPVPFATYPRAAPLRRVLPWKPPKPDPDPSTPFTGPPNLVDMAVDPADEVAVVGSESADERINRKQKEAEKAGRVIDMAVDAAEVEVMGSESVDDRINRQQREAEKAGQVVDFSGVAGAAADMDVEAQEQMRKRMLADVANRSVPAAADEAMQKRRRQDALALGAAERNRDNSQVQYEEMRGSGGGGTLSDLAAFKAGMGEIGEMRPTLDVKRELLVPNAAPTTPAEPSLAEAAAQYTREDFNQHFIDQGSTKDADRLARIAEIYGSVADYEGNWDNSMGIGGGAEEDDGSY